MTSFHSQKVLVGFSGGADSTAAVLLLQKQGYHVAGFHFTVLQEKINEEVDRVHSVAKQLDIRLIHQDISDEFRNKVIHPFCNAYKSGFTPNPCVLCNPLIKFKALYQTAQEMGFDKIATGHYARIYSTEDNLHFIRQAKNIKKDQSYVLYRLEADLLAHTLFPLGEAASKEAVREMLKNYKLSNAEAKDSQDICFIKNSTYKDFLFENGITSSPGHYIDKSGQILGMHQGITNYTIGQRKGLGQTFGRPMFVIGIQEDNNTVVLGEEEDLYKDFVSFSNPFYTAYGRCASLPSAYENLEVNVKLRYTAKPARAILCQQSNPFPTLHFLEPQRAPTPGQSAVLYEDDIVLGGGLII